jgi:chromosome segregation ATPase
MSDQRNFAALTPAPAPAIVAEVTPTLIGASLGSVQAITEANQYLRRSVEALEHIHATLQGVLPDGTPHPLSVTASLENASAQTITGAITTVLQPQITALQTAIATAQQQLGAHGSAIATAQQQLVDNTTAIAAAQQQLTDHTTAIAAAQQQLTDHTAAIATNQQAITTTNVALQSEVGVRNQLKGQVDALALRQETFAARQTAETSAVETQTRMDMVVNQVQTGEMIEQQQVLRDRISELEAAVRQLIARGFSEGRDPPRSTSPGRTTPTQKK